jgi:hypothetical protein
MQRGALVPPGPKENDLGRLVSGLYTGFAKGKAMEGYLLNYTGFFFTNPDPVAGAAVIMAAHNLLNTFPATLPFSQALPSWSPISFDIVRRILKTYDQYEFAVPLPLAAACVQGLFDIMAKDDQLRGDARLPIMFRVVKEESHFLSLTRGGPRLFINFDNYQLYNGKGRSLR